MGGEERIKFNDHLDDPATYLYKFQFTYAAMHKSGRSYDPYSPCVTFGIFILLSQPSTMDFSWYPPLYLFLDLATIVAILDLWSGTTPNCLCLILFLELLWESSHQSLSYTNTLVQITVGWNSLSNHCHVSIPYCSLCLYHVITLPSDPHGLVMVLIWVQ